MMGTVSDLLALNSSDPRTRIDVGQKLLACVQSGELEADSNLLSQFVDVMSQWMSGTNFKVALLSLEILSSAIDALGESMVSYTVDITPTLMERFGDFKETVRQEAHALVLKLMGSPGASPQVIFDRLLPGFSHKQWLVRVGVMQVLQNALRSYGSGCLQLSKVVPNVCKLVGDPNSQVRDTAADTIVEMYIHVGDKLEQDIVRRKLIPEARTANILNRLADAKQSGLVKSDSTSSGLSGYDQPDFAISRPRLKPQIPPKPGARPHPLPAGYVGSGRGARAEPPSPSTDRPTKLSNGSANSYKSRASSVPASKRGSATGSRAGGAGAVDEEFFFAAFEDVPKVQFYSAKELQGKIDSINEILSNASADWDKRVDSLKKLRSVVINGALQYDEFPAMLKVLEGPTQMAIKDLRSQVVREASITVAYLSEQMLHKFDHFAETVMPNLINLIQNSAKVMSTSGLVACRFIIKNTPFPKLIPLIASFATSKSREIRRACFELISQLLHCWETHHLERNVAVIEQALRSGLSDADPEARSNSRKAYWGFEHHFKEQADSLFQSLEPSKQRQLRGEMSQSSSSNSITVGGPGGLPPRSSQENLRSNIAAATKTGYLPNRSTSDIDTGAARKAMQRHNILAARTRQPLANINSLQRPSFRAAGGPPPIANSHSATSAHSSRAPRSTAKNSTSQPGSRSNSPSSRHMISRRPAGRIPAPTRSHGGSREQSPTTAARNRRLSSDTASPYTPGSVSRYMAPTRDMEKAVATAFTSDRRRANTRTSVDNAEFADGLHSETSSVCSDRVQTPSHGFRDPAELGEILRLCASMTLTERKDGLNTLNTLIKSKSRHFSAGELKKICDTFNRLFVDPNNKAFSLFLDTAVEFLYYYRTELTDWLYVLLTRLIAKLGSDVLPSVHTKLENTLAVVRESFPYSSQFRTLIRYMLDPAQTPNAKVKVSLLAHMHQLVDRMEPCEFANTSDVRAATSKIVQWAADPKSMEVRRASQAVLVALFSLNSPEFTIMLSTFSRSLQDTVYTLLQEQQIPGTAKGGSGSGDYAESSPRWSEGITAQTDPFDMSDVQNSLRQTSAEIQNYRFPTAAAEPVSGSQDSGIVDMPLDSAMMHRLNGEFLNTNGVGRFDLMGGSTDEDRQQEIIGDILTELSNHNRRVEERLQSLTLLRHMTQDGSFSLWDEHFKTILLMLLETLGDTNKDIRSSALKVLKQISLTQAARFTPYAELTILKLLEAHRDSEKEVVRQAEECAGALASNLPPSTSLRVLNPILAAQKDAVLLPAIKMATKVIDQLSSEEVVQILPDISPGIVEGYQNEESSIRKASVICLVAIHNAVGAEAIEPYISKLNSSKLKLFNLYAKRGQSGNSPSPH